MPESGNTPVIGGLDLLPRLTKTRNRENIALDMKPLTVPTTSAACCAESAAGCPQRPAITREQLTALEDQHILEVLKRQQAAGLKIFTDGELRRAGFMSDFYDSVEGLDHGGEIARTWKGAPSAIGGTSGASAAGPASPASPSRRSSRPSA